MQPIAADKNAVLNDLMEAKSMIIVPGYGMAISGAQTEVGNLVQELRKRGKKCIFSIHAVAGRIPGHMDVLLAEANIPCNIVYEAKKVNSEFENTDVVVVIGANDIVNPDALENPNSVIAGMSVSEVWKAKKVYVIKRGGGKGYAAIENPLFVKPNCRMYYGDAKDKLKELLNGITTVFN